MDVPAHQPQPEPMPEPAPSPPPKPAQHTNAITIVWQWVSYGLWELALISLCVLLSGALTYFFVHGTAGSDYTFSIYFLAAVLCLLPPAFIVDAVYMKREPAQKHGFAAVVMVLNGVVVFLAALAAFITAVMTVISIIVDGVGSSAKTITIISALVVAVLGGLLFVRIINPEKLQPKAKYFRYITAGVAAVALILAIVGPVHSLFANRKDRLLEDNLSTVQDAVNTYAYNNKKLPASLNDVSVNYAEGAKQLIASRAITYKPNTKLPVGTLNVQYSSKTYYYQLCATYRNAKGDQRDWELNKEANYIYGSHPSGYWCYDLSVAVYTN